LDACVDAGTCAKPTAENTGHTGDVSGTVEYNITSPGIYENFTAGCIKIKASDVTIRNAVIHSNGSGEDACAYGIEVTDNQTNVQIINVTLSGSTSSAIKGANKGGSLRIYKSRISATGTDGIKVWNDTTIEQNYITDLGTVAGAHADGVQMVAGNNIIMAANNFDMLNDEGYLNSQCIIAQSDNGPLSKLSIRRNWVRGAGYCIQILVKEPEFGNPTEYELLNNVSGCGHQFGPWVFEGTPVLSGNYYDQSSLCAAEGNAGQVVPARVVQKVGYMSGPYDFNEEGLPRGLFYLPNGTTDSLVDPDNTSPSMEGTENLALQSSSSVDYIKVMSRRFTPSKWLYFQFSVTNLPSNSNTTLMELLDTRAKSIGYLQLRSSQPALRVAHGDAVVTGPADLIASTVYQCWVYYIPATSGNNGQLKVYYSSDGVKPASPAISIANGTSIAYLSRWAAMHLERDQGPVFFDSIAAAGEEILNDGLLAHPTIQDVSDLNLGGTALVDLDHYTGTPTASINRVLTPVTIVSETQVSLAVPNSVNAAPNSIVSVVITDTNGASAPFRTRLLPPEEFQSQTVAVLAPASDIARHPDLSEVVTDDAVISLPTATRMDAAGITSFSIDQEGWFVFSPGTPSGLYEVEIGFYDASDGYSFTAPLARAVIYHEAPVMPADATISTSEDQSLIGNYAATGGSAPFTYELAGNQAGLFKIDEAGNLSWVTLPDFDTNPGPFNVSIIGINRDYEGEEYINQTDLTIQVTDSE
jgi:hypothetical protein